MYPWAVAVKKIGMPGLVEIVVFMFILFMGLLYAWKKGCAEVDVKPQTPEGASP